MIDKILNRLAEAEQPLPRSLEFYRLILTAQKESKQPNLSLTITALKEKATRQLAQGKPALVFRDLTVDWADAQNLACKVAALADEYLSPESEETDEVNEISTNLTLLKKTAREWFGAGTISRKSTTKSKSLKPLTGSILQAALHPMLAAYADELISLVEQDRWYRSYCPVCGGSPDFSFLDKEKGARWLICSRCNAQWLFNRLACPYCGNQDHKSLAYFTDDKKMYRLHVCEKCHRYLKTIDLRQTESEILLPLERILTLDMDRQAYESKYRAE